MTKKYRLTDEKDKGSEAEIDASRRFRSLIESLSDGDCVCFRHLHEAQDFKLALIKAGFDSNIEFNAGYYGVYKRDKMVTREQIYMVVGYWADGTRWEGKTFDTLGEAKAIAKSCAENPDWVKLEIELIEKRSRVIFSSERKND